ncbi:MAG: hypothetical protein H7343_08650 [Undibacterium sp.]|nr:hypothetical protein [Opitutaceae bacterium]
MSPSFTKTLTALLFLVTRLGNTASGASPVLPRVASFSNLPKSDVLRVTIHTQNCFGPSTRAEFAYRLIGSGHFDVVKLTLSAALFGNKRRIERLPMGQIELDPGEAQKLDTLIAAYRSPPITDVIELSGNLDFTISQLRGSRVIAEESFRNPVDSRALPLGETLTFCTLLAAVESALTPLGHTFDSSRAPHHVCASYIRLIAAS